MNDSQRSQVRTAPTAVWIVRLVFLVVMCGVGGFWLRGGEMTDPGQLVLGAYAATCLIAVIASFVPSKVALIIVCTFVIGVPLAGFLMINILVLRGTWWEWCFVFPAQIGIPIAIAYYLLKSPEVRGFYQRKGDGR